MPRANRQLINVLHVSANRLAGGSRYEWGHVGRCNCGHLVQSVSQKTDVEIFRCFGQDLDEWTEHANDYCASTGRPVDELFEELGAIGFDRDDVRHLEYLSDRRVLKKLPAGRCHLRRNHRADVVLYMKTMAELLEEELNAGR
jgi:hypothetical protein